jgi:ACR3 family arsenite efflux pump ArsB
MKVGRYLLILIISAIIGGIVGGVIGTSTFKQLITNVQFENHSMTILLTIITLLINIVLLIVLFRTQRKSLYFKNKLDEDIDGDRG